MLLTNQIHLAKQIGNNKDIISHISSVFSHVILKNGLKVMSVLEDRYGFGSNMGMREVICCLKILIAKVENSQDIVTHTSRVFIYNLKKDEFKSDICTRRSVWVREEHRNERSHLASNNVNKTNNE